MSSLHLSSTPKVEGRGRSSLEMGLSLLSPLDSVLFDVSSQTAKDGNQLTSDWLVFCDKNSRVRRLAEISSEHEGYYFGRIYRPFNRDGLATCMGCTKPYKFVLREGKCVISTPHACAVKLVDVKQVPSRGPGGGLDAVTARVAEIEDFIHIKADVAENCTLSATQYTINATDVGEGPVSRDHLFELEGKILDLELKLANMKIDYYNVEKTFLKSGSK